MDLNDARSRVVALLIKCPYEANVTDCYLHDMRKKSLLDNMETAKQLSEVELEHILAVHKKCLSRREGKRSP